MLHDPRFKGQAEDIASLTRGKSWQERLDPQALQEILRNLSQSLPPRSPLLNRRDPVGIELVFGFGLLTTVAVWLVIRRQKKRIGDSAPPGIRSPRGLGVVSGTAGAELIEGLPDRYTDFQLLGQGGMGAVFCCQDSLLKRKIALKVMTFPGGREEIHGQRFLREAQVLAALDHPGILRVHDVSLTPRPYLTMELVEGESLSAYLARKGRLEVDEVVNLCISILAGLAYAHHNGVIHRDLKPANVQRTPDGAVKLLDFGLAKFADQPMEAISSEGSIAGTAQYIAPEQLRGEQATPRSDLYAVGIILYELITGRTPFEGTQIYSKVYNPIIPPSQIEEGLPEDLDEVVLRALAIDPTERYQKAQEFQQALLDQGRG
jgi:serine/threonine-protein kinase